ncbi:Transport and Golgi organization protein 2 [Bulinus truncatus]|nr:Transport and Golgi organization protein 2 [Bulinus truncatus]
MKISKCLVCQKRIYVCSIFVVFCLIVYRKAIRQGLDVMPGRAGGTWLGMSKDGKIGALLNILAQQDLSKEGRGFLVTDYIGGQADIYDYASKILENKDKYNGFNLVLFDLSKQEDSLPVKPIFISNTQSYFSCINYRSLPSNTFFGVSNSPLEFPFQKVVQGKQKFGEIVSRYPKINTKDLLVENLLHLMSDQTPLLPDPVLEKAGASVGFSPERIRQQSAINVVSAEAKYGTRSVAELPQLSWGTALPVNLMMSNASCHYIYLFIRFLNDEKADIFFCTYIFYRFIFTSTA